MWTCGIVKHGFSFLVFVISFKFYFFCKNVWEKYKKLLIEVWVGFGSKLGKFWVRIGIILTDLQYWCNPDWSPNTRRMYCKCTVNCTQCTVLYTRLVPSVHFWWKSNNLPPIFFLSISARMNECCTHLLHSILLYSIS